MTPPPDNPRVRVFYAPEPQPRTPYTNPVSTLYEQVGAWKEPAGLFFGDFTADKGADATRLCRRMKVARPGERTRWYKIVVNRGPFPGSYAVLGSIPNRWRRGRLRPGGFKRVGSAENLGAKGGFWPWRVAIDVS